MKLEVSLQIGDFNDSKDLKKIDHETKQSSDIRIGITPNLIGFKQISLICDDMGCWWNGQRYSVGSRVNMGTSDKPDWKTCRSGGSKEGGSWF